MTLQEVQKNLKDLSDADDAAFLQGYFKTGKGEYGEGDQFRGIRVPKIRKLVPKCNALSWDEVTTLLHSDFHEDRLLALLILVNRFEKTTGTERERIYNHYIKNTRYINNWDLVDQSAPNITGAFLMNRPKDQLLQWARSDKWYERRIAIMSTFHFIRNHHFDLSLKLAGMLLDDPHDLIHKSVGWMLREIGKRDQKREEEFLESRYQNMPRTMLRYAIEKFPESRRQDYLNGLI